MKINPIFQRLALITGAETLEFFSHIRVIVCGVGGVGSWCAEALVRSGIGSVDLVDSDTICITNVNRQVQARCCSVGRVKVDELAARLHEINPQCRIRAYPKVFSRETAGIFNIEESDYVIDAIDSLSCKLDLIETAAKAGVTLFSSMGMAQKLDPLRLKTAGIWETSGCPLARLVRSGLRRRGFNSSFLCVYSDERLPLHTEIAVSCGSAQCMCPVRKNSEDGFGEWCSSKKVINGSAVTVTASAGMILASLVIRDLCGKTGKIYG
ncbi:MAG: ThiF family adenylyltransferase [Treponema sp.]|jgi:tRNA A37 threonylcarbamoyladenosine dehydratase|nr:ThiF family adenylyltransferase [Treponema sp.]